MKDDKNKDNPPNNNLRQTQPNLITLQIEQERKRYLEERQKYLNDVAATMKVDLFTAERELYCKVGKAIDNGTFTAAITAVGTSKVTETLLSQINQADNNQNNSNSFNNK